MLITVWAYRVKVWARLGVEKRGVLWEGLGEIGSLFCTLK